MKKLLSFLLTLIAVTLPTLADEPQGSSSTSPVGLDVSRSQNPDTPMHRAPTRIDIEAYYNAEDGTLNISYDGEAAGEVYLYLNDSVIGYDCDINTSFQISSPGLYKIEIVGESWIAEGYLQL